MPESRPPAKNGRNYKPTGRPPGRPRKDGLPKANENPDGSPKPPRQPKARPDTAKVKGHPEGVPSGHPKPGVFPICPEHFEDGWPKGWTTATCNHDGEAKIWARPWVP